MSKISLCFRFTKDLTKRFNLGKFPSDNGKVKQFLFSKVWNNIIKMEVYPSTISFCNQDMLILFKKCQIIAEL